MRFTPNIPPRPFNVGNEGAIQLKDCARVELEPDEQITLITRAGGEYDIVRKSWGFYATPSLNRRLKNFGLRGVIVKSPALSFYILLVERGKEAEFQNYLATEGHSVICWLDDTDELNRLERKLRSADA